MSSRAASPTRPWSSIPPLPDYAVVDENQDETFDLHFAAKFACCPVHARGEQTADRRTWCWSPNPRRSIGTSSGGNGGIELVCALADTTAAELVEQIRATAARWRADMKAQMAHRDPGAAGGKDQKQ